MAEGGSSGSSVTSGGAAVQPNQHGRTTTTTTTTAPPQQQHQSLSRPSSPPRPTGSPPPAAHPISKHHSSSMLQYNSGGAISSQGNTAAAGVPWSSIGQRHRRASTGWDMQKDAGGGGSGGSGGQPRLEGTRKVRGGGRVAFPSLHGVFFDMNLYSYFSKTPTHFHAGRGGRKYRRDYNTESIQSGVLFLYSRK